MTSPLHNHADWRHRSCRGQDPAIFFPVTGESPEAEAICRGCPIRAECLDFALRNHQAYGVWGGMGEAGRRRITRRSA